MLSAMHARRAGSLLSIAGGILALCCVGGGASAADSFVLTLPAFKDGASIPGTKYAGNLKINPNCVGENVSPPLAWSNPPTGTKSFALLLYDPEGKGGAGITQWVAYGIPASMTDLAEGEGSQPSSKIMTGKNSLGPDGYIGPCAPQNAPHHYVFTLIANDLEPQALKPGLTRDELSAALGGHVKGVAGLVGTYARP
jgi:Raf kinase inhibitor-like YbhB/YbcL family protein